MTERLLARLPRGPRALAWLGILVGLLAIVMYVLYEGTVFVIRRTGK